MTFIRLFVRWLLGREKLTTQPVIELRHAVCESCTLRRRGWFRWFCEACGCTLSRRRWPFNKLAYGSQECPIKRWMQTHGEGETQDHDKD